MKVIWTLWLVWMSVLDCRTRYVPRWIFWNGVIAGLIWHTADLIWKSGSSLDAKELALGWLLGTLPGVFLVLVAWLTKAVGFGDGMVLMSLGIVVGVRKAVLVLAVALFAAALCSVGLLLVKKVGLRSRLPFLPFLTLGWFLIGIGG